MRSLFFALPVLAVSTAIAQSPIPAASRACYVPASGTVYLIGIGSAPGACLSGHTEVKLGLGFPIAVNQNSNNVPLLHLTNPGSGSAAHMIASGATSTAFFLNTDLVTGNAVHAESKGSLPTLAAHNTGTTGPAIHTTSNAASLTLGVENHGTVGSAIHAKSKGSGATVYVENTGSGQALAVVANGSADLAFFHQKGSGRAIGAVSTVAFPEATAVFNNIGGLALRLDGSGQVNGNLDVFQGALRVHSGLKNAVVHTSRGKTEVYSEESSEVWFTDYGSARISDGTAWVPIDPHYAETVTLRPNYHVFLQAYNRGTLYVADRTPSGFRVRMENGPSEGEFSYRIVAKRKGFEKRRLDLLQFQPLTRGRLNQ